MIPLKYRPEREPFLGNSENAIEIFFQLRRDVAEVAMSKGFHVLQTISRLHCPKHFEV